MSRQPGRLIGRLAAVVTVILGPFVMILVGYRIIELTDLQSYETGTLLWVSVAAYLAISPIRQLLYPNSDQSRIWQIPLIALCSAIILLPLLRDWIGISLPFMWSLYSTSSLFLAIAYGGVFGLLWELLVHRLFVARLGFTTSENSR
mgnify:CR=1 FL=1